MHAGPEDHHKRLRYDGTCPSCKRVVERREAMRCRVCKAPGVTRPLTFGVKKGQEPNPCAMALMLYGHYCEIGSDPNGRPLSTEVDRTLERMGVTDPEQSELIRGMWSACTSVIADEQERQMDALRKPVKGAPH